MIALIAGQVAEIEPKALLITTGGLGYRVRVGGAVLMNAKVGQEISLRTYHHMTENEQILFGFADKQELRYFELLLTVPSIGPKTAMGILDAAPPIVLTQAVLQKDISLLTKISGVGHRTAERILVELSGKLEKLEGVEGVMALPTSVHQEAVEALISIGFKPAQAKQKVASLPTDISTVEEAVKAALKTS